MPMSKTIAICSGAASKSKWRMNPRQKMSYCSQGRCRYIKAVWFTGRIPTHPTNRESDLLCGSLPIESRIETGRCFEFVVKQIAVTLGLRSRRLRPINSARLRLGVASAVPRGVSNRTVSLCCESTCDGFLLWYKRLFWQQMFNCRQQFVFPQQAKLPSLSYFAVRSEAEDYAVRLVCREIEAVFSHHRRCLSP